MQLIPETPGLSYVLKGMIAPKKGLVLLKAVVAGVSSLHQV